MNRHPRLMLAILLVSALLLAGCYHSVPGATLTPRITEMRPDIPAGGRAVAVATHPSDSARVLAASETGGLFRSLDGGLSWQHVSAATTFWFTDVTFVPSAADVALATANTDTRVVTGGGIWRSTDGGGSWARVAVTTPNPACALDISGLALEAERDRDRVWAGTSCGLAFSDDGGASWSFVAASSNYANDPTFSVVAPTPGRIAILTPAGVKVSTTDGASWTLSTTGLPSGIFGGGVHNYLAVAPNDADHLYRVLQYRTTNTAGVAEDHITLYRSLDFGGAWSVVIDNVGRARPPFVRTAQALGAGPGSYDVYWSDGGCTLQRASATTGSASVVSAWTRLTLDHCDPADLTFHADGRTPLVLASDGGLHKTFNNGRSWTMMGSGPSGYNALQITEVTGQLHVGRGSADLYFGTQDNDIWASPDNGATWPRPNRCCEGFFLNVWRDPLPAGETRFTGVSCAGCGNFMSGPRLAGQVGFPNPPDNAGNPRLVEPGAYIHNTRPPGVPGNTFALTTDNGATWNARYGFPEDVRDLPKVSGPRGSPVVYTAARVPGSVVPGAETLLIKRVENVLGTGTPLVSTVGGPGTGLNSLGIYPTMFAWYKPFGVHPTDPNLLMASDILDQQVKVSRDGGATWVPDVPLTTLVTGSGAFKFSWGAFTQTSTFAFNPDCNGHIVVGTRQAGIMETTNGGATWSKIPGSEHIPEVSSVFFGKKVGREGEMVVSSYGRSLWRITYECVPLLDLPRRPVVVLDEPVIYWKGGKVPLRQVGNPDACPVCAFVLAQKGEVLDYELSGDQLASVTLSDGALKAYTWDGQEVETAFKVAQDAQRGDYAEDKALLEELEAGKARVKGLFLEDGRLRGVLLHTTDVTVDDLPEPTVLGPYLRVDATHLQEPYRLRGIPIRGTDFEPDAPVEILVDGEPAVFDEEPKVDANGELTALIAPVYDIGGHTVTVRQKGQHGLVEDVTTFLVTVEDYALEQEKLQEKLQEQPQETYQEETQEKLG